MVLASFNILKHHRSNSLVQSNSTHNIQIAFHHASLSITQPLMQCYPRRRHILVIDYENAIPTVIIDNASFVSVEPRAAAPDGDYMSRWVALLDVCRAYCMSTVANKMSALMVFLCARMVCRAVSVIYSL